MERKALVNEVKEYFADSDHWRRLCASLQDPDPWGTHIHAYAEMSVHPDSLEKIMTEYFKRMGWPSARKIDHMAPKKGMGSLHGVEAKGKPHFDYQWFFNKDVGLRALEGGESGCNLLIWNRWYINRFYDQFSFRKVGTGRREGAGGVFQVRALAERSEIARSAHDEPPAHQRPFQRPSRRTSRSTPRRPSNGRGSRSSTPVPTSTWSTANTAASWSS